MNADVPIARPPRDLLATRAEQMMTCHRSGQDAAQPRHDARWLPTRPSLSSSCTASWPRLQQQEWPTLNIDIPHGGRGELTPNAGKHESIMWSSCGVSGLAAAEVQKAGTVSDSMPVNGCRRRQCAISGSRKRS